MGKKYPRRKKSVSTYYVPKRIYDEAYDAIEEKSKENPFNIDKSILLKCHQDNYCQFNSSRPALCESNLLEAVKQSFADRNFPVLYELIRISLVVKSNFLTSQLFQYLIMAVEIDPKIENRNEFLLNVVKGLKGYEKDDDAKAYIREMHLLKIE